MEISVVICSYHEARWEALVAAVESVEAQSRAPAEVVLVVDNNPALADRVRDRWPDHVVVDHRGEPGVSGARNAGIAAAGRGAVVAFVDDDAAAATDWLERIADAYAREDALGVGGRIEPVWTEGRPGWFPPEFDWVVGCTHAGYPDRVASVRNVTGANMSFRRDVLEALEGFEPQFGRCCDETELCIRAHRRWPERSIVYDPAVRVSHLVPSERSSWGYFVGRCFLEGRMKATVARLRGDRDALSSELAHTVRVLPVGILRGLRDGVIRADAAGPGRAGAIVVGLAVTAAGYVVERLRPARRVGQQLR